MDREKQNENFIKEDAFLKMHLDTYHIDIPDIPRRKSRIERLIRFLASPTKNPFEGYVNNLGGLASLTISPIIIGAILFILPYIL